MGLDMYLVEGRTGAELKYWRKANQIRQWFVDHIDEFEPTSNCEYYEVSKELLEELVSDIEYVLSGETEEERIDRASERIPTSSGFFFGNTDYDEYYFLQLESTLEDLKEILANWCDWYEVNYSEWW